MQSDGLDKEFRSGKPYRPLLCRGIRGAITVEQNDPGEILSATRELLERIISANGLQSEDVASAYFTTTVDLNAAYPAEAARQIGWLDVPLICGHEMNVPTGLRRCIRVLIHWNTRRSQKEIVHVYVGEARSLRPEHSSGPTSLGVFSASSDESSQTPGEAR